MIKINFVDSNSFSKGGAIKSMIHLASWLSDKSDTEVSVYSPVSNHISSLALSDNVHFIDTGLIDVSRTQTISRFKKLFRIVKYWFTSANHIDWKGSFVCVNEPKSILYYLPFLLINRKRCIYYVRINERIKFVNTFAALFFPKILLISSSSKNAFRPSLLSHFPGKFEVLNTGFTIESQSLEPTNSLNLCYVASLCERKNQMFLVRVMQQVTLKYPTVKLSLFGDSPLGFESYKNELEVMIHDAGLSQTIIFEGHCGNIPERLTEYSVFLMPSYLEGLPRVVIEGLLAGLFVVSVPTDGVSDIITNPKLGVILDSYSIDTFSSQVVKHLDYIVANQGDEMKLKSYRANYAEEHFSKDKFVNGFLDVLNRMK